MLSLLDGYTEQKLQMYRPQAHDQGILGLLMTQVLVVVAVYILAERQCIAKGYPLYKG